MPQRPIILQATAAQQLTAPLAWKQFVASDDTMSLRGGGLDNLSSTLCKRQRLAAALLDLLLQRPQCGHGLIQDSTRRTLREHWNKQTNAAVEIC